MEQRRPEENDVLMMVAHELRTPLTVAKAMLELSQAAVAQGRTVELPAFLALVFSPILPAAARGWRTGCKLQDAGEGCAGS